MKIRELREKTKIELNELLKEKREALRRFRFDVSHGRAKNTKEARGIKKDIARITTLLGQFNK